MNRRHKNRPDTLTTSEAELSALTADLDELHHDESLPALRASVAEWVEVNHEHQAEEFESDLSLKLISRRGLLLGTGAFAVGGLLLAACGTSKSATTTTTVPNSPASLTGDLKVAAVAVSLENLGVYAYGAGIKAAQAGKLGTVPPAIVTFATTAMSQHTQHAAAGTPS